MDKHLLYFRVLPCVSVAINHSHHTGSVVLPDPDFRGAGVGGQTLAVGENGGGPAEHAGARRRALDQAGAFLEIIDAERRGKPRRARGRQNMVRTRAVIPENLRGVAPHENSTGVADLRRQGLVVGEGFGRLNVLIHGGFGGRVFTLASRYAALAAY